MNFRRSIITAEFHFLHFWKNDSVRKIFKILFGKDSSRQRATCCVQISLNLTDGKSVKLCVIYLTKKQILPGSPALATARSAPKSATASPRHVLQISCRSVHFPFGGVISERVNTVREHSKVNQIFV